MVKDPDDFMKLGVERHAGLRITWVAKVFEYLHRFADDVSDTVEDGAGLVAGMADRPFEVVHDGKPRTGHFCTFPRALVFQFACVPLAKVVQVGNRAPPAILEASELFVSIILRGNGFSR